MSSNPDTWATVKIKGLSLKKTGPCCLWMAPCLMIIEAIALLVKDAAKFTLGQELTVICLMP